MMERYIFCLFFILYIQETSQHPSCCLKKEVDGIEYEHIDDHGLLLPSTCKNHCVYKKVGETEDKHYCFGNGTFTTKCLEAGKHGECKPHEDVFVAPAMTDRILTVNTTNGEFVYGPWSNERLSSYQFEVLLNDRQPTKAFSTAALSFSPCYKCKLIYQIRFDLYKSGNSFAGLFVNGEGAKRAGFDYTLGPDAPAAKFIVQTIPEKMGVLRIKAQFVKPDGTKQDIFDYSIVPDNTFGNAPFGITYAVLGSDIQLGGNTAASYTFRDVDRAPEFYPIADCREGENSGLTVETDNSVKIKRLSVTEPVQVKNVDPSQLWCVVSNGNPCACTRKGRGHVQPNGPEGTVINKQTCKFLKASPASANNPGGLSLVDNAYESTIFQFIVAPNTEINQLRFGDNNVSPFTTYVISWDNDVDFENGVGTPVTKIGRETNPLTSCFKAYKFLSNVPDTECGPQWIIKNRLVTTLPSWGAYFEVSFEMWVESFSGPNSDGWTEFLRFTTTEADLDDNIMVPGSRIPAVFVNTGGYIGVRSQVGNNANFAQNTNIQEKTWIKVEIKQYPKNGQVLYEVIVDGNSVVPPTPNTNAKVYENVKLQASGYRYPAANAKIRNLKANDLTLQLC